MVPRQSQLQVPQTSPRVLGKLRWATKLFDLNGTIKKQHMHIISKMFVFIWRKVLIYKNWTWIVFTFCKIKTLIVIFISWAAYHWRKWFKSFSSTYGLSSSHIFRVSSDYGCKYRFRSRFGRLHYSPLCNGRLCHCVMPQYAWYCSTWGYSCRGSYFLISCCSRR